MKVVLDTNVIVAAFATRGLCAEVFEVCLLDRMIVLSDFILSEVKEKLIAKIHLPHGIVHEIIYYLKEHAEIVSPKEVKVSTCKDKDDLRIIGTAVSGNAKFIITGDKDLLILRKYKDIKIVTPREFWDILK